MGGRFPNRPMYYLFYRAEASASALIQNPFIMNRKINRKSDFDFILALTGADGNPLGWQEANWELTLYVDVPSGRNFAYKAYYAFGECINCRNADGKIEILVDNHEFPVGELLMDFNIEIPDERYPDRNRSINIPEQKTGIELVNDRGLAVSGLEIPLSVPIKPEAKPEPEEKPEPGKPEEGEAESDSAEE